MPLFHIEFLKCFCPSEPLISDQSLVPGDAAGVLYYNVTFGFRKHTSSILSGMAGHRFGHDPSAQGLPSNTKQRAVSIARAAFSGQAGKWEHVCE